MTMACVELGLTPDEALTAVTINAARALGLEDDIGSIEPGKLADLTVLDRDYFTIPDADIKKIRSVLTIVGGKVVHDSKALKA